MINDRFYVRGSVARRRQRNLLDGYDKICCDCARLLESDNRPCRIMKNYQVLIDILAAFVIKIKGNQK